MYNFVDINFHKILINLFHFLVEYDFRIRGGHGSYGVSRDFTYQYFQQGLENKLNKKLAKFLKSQRKSFGDLDPKCFKYETEPEPEVEPETSAKNLKPTLTNHPVEVVELLSDKSGVLKSCVSNWKCFFTNVHALLPPGTGFQTALKPGTVLSANVTLMDKSKPLQYIANLVWFDHDYPDRDMRRSKPGNRSDTSTKVRRCL